MNDLCCDIGWLSLTHEGEELCGDSVECIEAEDGTTLIVLADGLGSGVKASILSTLTAKMISTMLVAGIPLDEAVSTIVDTLPVCYERGIAYSTFNVIRIDRNERVEIIQYDSPHFILIRNGNKVDLNMRTSYLGDKKILRTEFTIVSEDILMLCSDGVLQAGPEHQVNHAWEYDDVAAYIKDFWGLGFTAKTLSKFLLDHVNELYEGKPADDATVCTVIIKKRKPLNILIGPPTQRDDANRMMALFFAKDGKHVVCGGTSAEITAKFLNKKLKHIPDSGSDGIPPLSQIEGVDLVTEGIVTISRVLEYAQNYLLDNNAFTQWNTKRDGAAQIARLLFEEATDINFFIGHAVNPAHQNQGLKIGFDLKMKLMNELTDSLKRMGKRVTVCDF